MRGKVLAVIGVLGLGSPAAAGNLPAVGAPPGFDDACRRYEWLCRGESRAASSLADEQLLGLAARVNGQVNWTITQVDDSVTYGVAEYWALPVNGRGDCEDLALLKMKMLLDLGVDPKLLLMAVVIDRRGANHAVLLLRLVSTYVILDSLTGTIAPWQRSGYRLLARQSVANRDQWEALLPAAGQ